MKRRLPHRLSRALVAVVWDHHELLAAVARPTAQGVKLIDSLQIPITKPGGLKASADQLAEQLRERNISSYQLLIGLPRSQVDMLILQLPQATPAELPEMVRNEVTRQLPDLPDESPIDFWVPSPDPASPTLTVEAAALRGETMELVRTVSQQVKQRPAQIVIRSLATASLFVRQVANVPDHALLLNLLKSTADISLLSGSRVHFTRSIHVAENHDEEPDVGQLADEIRRTLFVAPNALSQSTDDDGQSQHIFLLADPDHEHTLAQQLAEELQLQVTVVDPLAGTQLASENHPTATRCYAALIGMIWDYVQGSAILDFAHPKQAPPPPRVARRVAAYAVAGLVALTLIAGVLRRDVNRAAAEADALAVDVENNRELLEKLHSKTIVLDAVAQWERAEINWLEELRRLSDRFPAADEAVVQRITMAPTTGSRGVISMSVRVPDPAIVAQLEQKLRDDRHQVSSQRISQSESKQEFSTQFETTLTVAPEGRRSSETGSAKLASGRPAATPAEPTDVGAARR
jgi:Tfp pilus assembly PilM family ATPase